MLPHNYKMQVLVASMHQKDFSIIQKMNIKCNAVIANQCDCDKTEYYDSDGYSYLMVSSKTRGVGINRNIGLIYSDADILLFSDEDLIYYDGLESNVISAFEQFPDADVIAFGIDYTLHGEIYKKSCPKRGRLPFYRSLKYGTYAIAIKKSSVLKNNITFNELFGGGCIFSHGEDSDFIINCYKKHLKVYSYDYVLGKTAKDSSTCFDGYNEKYCYDAGALAKCSFGILAKPYMVYLSIRLKDRSDLSRKQMMRNMMFGYKNFDKLQPYDEFCSTQN